MTRKNLMLIVMWLYVCKSAVGCQFSEHYHVYDILVEPKEVMGDLLQSLF
jgi:hypothetical protein